MSHRNLTHRIKYSTKTWSKLFKSKHGPPEKVVNDLKYADKIATLDDDNEGLQETTQIIWLNKVAHVLLGGACKKT